MYNQVILIGRLGADAENEYAVSRIYKVKGRPQDHPLIVHISEIQDLDVWATEIPDFAIKLARDFWPGPMTLILKDYLGSNYTETQMANNKIDEVLDYEFDNNEDYFEVKIGDDFM